LKSLTLVTCLYDLVKRGSTQHRTVDWMLAHDNYVLALDHSLVIFAEPELEDEILRRRGGRPTKVITTSFEELLGADRIAASVRGRLQDNARREKVTPVYVQLMWAKYAMLECALKEIQTSHAGWIDIGISHVGKLPPDGRDIFADPSDLPRVHVLRCFSKHDVDHPDYWRLVQGHLAGGLVVGRRAALEDLVADFWRAVARAILMGLAPLDEGLLSYVVGQRPGDFSYSYGDYEDILRNHDGDFHGETHRQWIIEDARRRGLPPRMELIDTRKSTPMTQTEQTKPSPEVASLIQRVESVAMAGFDRPLLGLVMIVKNEAKRISEVLASYRPYINAWTILDTGSTDGTQDLIRKELDGIPGTLHEEPFVDFATSRNRALELHGLTTVFSIMPNGDVLSGGPALVDFLEAHRVDLGSGAYRVRIEPGHYYHPLVMRTGMGWRYKWRTHECAIGPNVGPQIDAVIVRRDRGARTDEEWRARWTRDLDLLNRDRQEDPSDPRPYFYLGQTHECLGQFEQALAFFERRAEMGGYFDEIYEAKYRIAKMKEKLGRPWPEIQQAFLDAFAFDPRRAEPLFAISDHYYDKVHAISRIFSIAAAQMEKPPTDLFLDESVYTWKSADRAAISSFYAGHKDSGRYWAAEAVAASPHDERIRANRAFFAQSAQELFGATAQAIDFTPEDGWNASNPSIIADGDRVRCIVRTVNYRIVNGSYVTPPNDLVTEDGPYKGWQVIRTRNFLLDLDADLKTTRSVELVDKTNLPRSTYPVHGFEDCRLFAWKGSWWATATVCDFTEHGAREIALLQIEDDGSVVRADALRGPWSGSAQKNWMPFVENDTLRFLYATDPSTVLELVRGEDQSPKILHATDMFLGHGRLRGGSQGVRVSGGWLFIVHDVAFPPGGNRLYLHRFVLLDDQFQLVAMTDPFFFEQLGIEFCAGLALVDGKLVASYAVNDGSARLGVVAWDAVRKALKKDFVI
jgi:tetratricopeptide (TPR) repeat protein